jgi:tRNA-specific 2-thiouridylase
VVVGDLTELMTDTVDLTDVAWVDDPASGDVTVQCSAHGAPVDAVVDGRTVRFAEPHRRVAPGQSVVLYRGDEVLGGGIAA